MKRALITAFTRRFQKMMEINEYNKELIVAAISHPTYKFDWLDIEDEHRAKQIFDHEAQKFYSISASDSDIETNNDGDIFITQRRTARRFSTDTFSREISDYTENPDVELKSLERYPTIKKIFFRFNTSLSSSAPIERVFSRALLIFTPRRNRISDANFERALFKKINEKLNVKKNVLIV